MLDKIGGAIGGYFGGPAGAAIGSAAGDFLSDAGSAYGSHREAEMTRAFNASQANLSRESQLELANTQYQRTVKDLNAAGLSPMLAYSKGPTAMPGAVTASSGAMGDAPKFGESGQRYATANLAKAQYEVNIQTAKKVAEEAKLAAQKVLQEPARFYLEQAVMGSQINQSTAQAGQTEALEALTRQGKAPAPDTNIVRNIKDAITHGGRGFRDAKSSLDNFISRTYKSIRGIK
jgi:hypothetical protein